MARGRCLLLIAVLLGASQPATFSHDAGFGDPQYGVDYLRRGVYYFGRHDYASALEVLNLAVSMQPNLIAALVYRAETNKALGRYAEAMADLDLALTRSPTDERCWALNDRAWLEATCVDAHFRNGRQAIQDAREACVLAEWKDSYDLDTLAAAYAEANDFNSAVKYEQQSIGLLKDKKDLADYQKHLALYRQHRSYRENKP